MDRGELTALLLTTEPEIRYFTGYLTQFWQSPTRPWFLILPSSGKPIAVIPAIGAECMGRTWSDDIRTWSSPAPEDEGVSLLAEALHELLGSGDTLGLMQGPETHLRMPLSDFERLQSRLQGIATADATPIIRSLRMVKSGGEIEKISYACACASDVFEALPDLIHAGMPVDEVFRNFKIASLQAGIDDVSYLVGGAGSGGYGDIISPPSNQPLAMGDILILDTGCIFDGYFCDFDRNYAIGAADDASIAAHACVYDATEAGFAAAKPGNTTTDIFNAMQQVMERGGALGNDVGRLGHGLGMQLTEWPSNTATDQTVIEPGMVLTLEPGMGYGDGKVMVHEENIVIEETGATWLSRRAPPKMPVIT